jgi:peptidoglycan/LPS O-acetylase OafA/YrhL
MAFHAGLPSFAGGFVGVDVFFVLSGFVVVRALLAEAAGDGIDLGAFWMRRFARLLPAAVTVVVISSGVFTLLSSPTERSQILADGRASLLSGANWWFLAESTDYFRDAVTASPFLHMWSLSAEEQFYVVIPLCMLWGLRRRRSDRAWIAGACALLGVALAWNILGQVRWSELRVYFGTDTRAYQLLLGACCAIALDKATGVRLSVGRLRVRQVVDLLAFITLAVVCSPLSLDANIRGLAVASATAAIVLTLAVSNEGLLSRTLCSSGLVTVGEISYGLYLVHWPVFVLLLRLVELGDVSLFVIGTLVSLVLAATLRRVVEVPAIRWARSSSDRGQRRPLLLLSLPVVAAFGLLPATLTSDVAPLAAAQRPGYSVGSTFQGRPSDLPVPADLGLTGVVRFERGQYCINTTVIESDCYMAGSGDMVVLVIGDSHADDLLPALATIAPSHGFRLHAMVTAGCPWQAGLAYRSFDTPSCIAAQTAIYDRLIDEVRPDLIIASSHGHADMGYELTSRETGSPIEVTDQVFSDATTSSARRLTAADTTRLVVVEPRPSAPFNVRDCLAAAHIIDDCAFVDRFESDVESETILRALEQIPRSTMVSFNDVICPRLPVCDAIVRGTLVRYDQDHLYGGFVQAVAEDLWYRISTAPSSADQRS